MTGRTETPEVLEVVDGDGFGLRAQFVRQGDRYAHQLLVLAPGRPTPVLESVETGDDSEWPPSPPLQQLSIEQLATRWAALGVGQAGTSHWSISIEALSEPNPTLRFSLACRLAIRPSRLGSQYRLIAAAPTVLSEGHPLEWKLPPRRLLVTPDSNNGSTWVDYRDGHLTFLRGNLQVPLPATLQWGYRVALLPLEPDKD